MNDSKKQEAKPVIPRLKLPIGQNSDDEDINAKNKNIFEYSMPKDLSAKKPKNMEDDIMDFSDTTQEYMKQPPKGKHKKTASKDMEYMKKHMTINIADNSDAGSDQDLD